MGNTVTVGKNISILFDAAPEDFNIATYFPGEVWLQAVKIFGAGSSMTMVIRNGSTTGEVLSDMTDTTGTGLKDSFDPPEWCKPFIDVTDCTIPNGSRVILEIA